MQSPKGRGWGEKVFPIMRGGAGMGQDKTMWGGDEDFILWPHPALLPFLVPNSISWQHVFFRNERREGCLS